MYVEQDVRSLSLSLSLSFILLGSRRHSPFTVFIFRRLDDDLIFLLTSKRRSSDLSYVRLNRH